jgi:hypothetical protein
VQTTHIRGRYATACAACGRRQKPSGATPCAWPLALILRKTTEQSRTEGSNPDIPGDDDYSVVDDEMRVGRISCEVVQGKPWPLWFAGPR